MYNIGKNNYNRRKDNMNKMVTLSISVNLASGGEWEGNAEFAITLPENHLKYIDRNKLAESLDPMLDQAIDEYNKRNNKS